MNTLACGLCTCLQRTNVFQNSRRVRELEPNTECARQKTTFEDQISDNVRDTSKQYSFSPNKREVHLAYQFKIFIFPFWGEGEEGCKDSLNLVFQHKMHNIYENGLQKGIFCSKMDIFDIFCQNQAFLSIFHQQWGISKNNEKY